MNSIKTFLQNGLIIVSHQFDLWDLSVKFGSENWAWMTKIQKPDCGAHDAIALLVAKT